MRFKVYKNAKGYWIIEKSTAENPTFFSYLNYYHKFEDARAEVARLADMARYFYTALITSTKPRTSGHRN